MTTRNRGKRSFRRGPGPIMSWFNNGIDMRILSASSSVTAEMLPNVILPAGFASGYTILRLIGRFVFAASDVVRRVNAVAALWVAPTLSLTTPPNLNADFLDYYIFTGLQSPIGAVNQSPNVAQVAFDLRSARRIRGEDRSVFARITNNEAFDMQIGLEFRALLKKS